MTMMEEDQDREERIEMEIVVDAYDEQERALGWYYHLEDALKFPFLARCSASRSISPLRKEDEVEVIGMAPEGECEREMFVFVFWENKKFAVPLSQLECVHCDDETRQGVEDWHYWVQMGYRF